jgi:hypothetical protein
MIKPFSIAAGLVLFSVTAVQAFDGRADNLSRATSCGSRHTQTCVVAAPTITIYDRLSDSGPGYDVQGNPIDRLDNIVATPARRAGGSREVFASEPRL